MKAFFISFFACLIFSGQLLARDIVETHDGSTLSGTIKQINAEHIVLSTDYAGDITLQRNKIIGFTSEQSQSYRLSDGTVLKGTVQQHKDNTLEIASDDMHVTTSLNQITEAWPADQQDPEITRREEEQQAKLRKWSYEAGLDITGKEGNSQEFGLAISFAAKLTGQDDTFFLYGSLDQAQQEGIDSADETIIGAEYSTYYNDPWGWYMRAEFERDDFEDIDLRSILGAGANYRVFHSPDHMLELRSGLGYRHERFNDLSKQQSPTLDFGLAHEWQATHWARMKNKLTYTPAIDDFKDYLITHDSSIEIPLGLSEYWQLRFGLRNDYQSLPADDRKHLDTSYYSKLQLAW